MSKFDVQIQAADRSWFTAHKGASLSPKAADKLIATLRTEGFTARAIRKDA